MISSSHETSLEVDSSNNNPYLFEEMEEDASGVNIPFVTQPTEGETYYPPPPPPADSEPMKMMDVVEEGPTEDLFSFTTTTTTQDILTTKEISMSSSETGGKNDDGFSQQRTDDGSYQYPIMESSPSYPYPVANRYILGLLPFTVHASAGGGTGSYSTTAPPPPPSSTATLPTTTTTSQQTAFTHMAAALMALDHFNTRNPIIVPELATLQQSGNCGDYRLPEFVFENTDSDAFVTSQRLMKPQSYSSNDVLAIVGPYTNEAAIAASTIASGLDIPLISHGVDDLRFTRYTDHPRATNVAVPVQAMSQVVVNYALSKLQRNETIATIHLVHKPSSGSSSIGHQYVQALKQATKQITIDGRKFDEHQIHSIIISGGDGGEEEDDEPNRSSSSSVGLVLNRIKTSGIRNIVLVLDDVENDLSNQLIRIASATEQYGMNTEDYTWILAAPRTLDLGEVIHVASVNQNVTNLVNGMAHISLLDGYYDGDENHPFLVAWRQQNATFVKRVNKHHPIQNPSTPGYFQASEDYFQTHYPQRGAGFMYDTVMSVALGKCNQLLAAKAEATQTAAVVGESSFEEGGANQGNDGSGANSNRDGALWNQDSNGAVVGNSVQNNRRSRRSGVRGLEDQQDPFGHTITAAAASPKKNSFHKAIMDTSFWGATGQVKFQNDMGEFPGNRRTDTVLYGAYNFRPATTSTTDNSGGLLLGYYLTDVHHEDPMMGHWEQTVDAPFIFASGTSTPPVLNRDVPEQNYLSQGVQAFGLTLMVFVLLCSIVSVIILKNSNNDSNQSARDQKPFFLSLILGTMLFSFSILPLSFDDSFISEVALDRMCQATPWLIILGYNCIYLALFSKLWDLDKVIQFCCFKLKAKQVVMSFAANILFTTILLLVWTVTDPQRWVREEIDPVTHESYGTCQSNNGLAYWVPLFCFTTLSTLACGLIAFKCYDAENRSCDFKSIFCTALLHFQVLIVGLPVIRNLDDVSTGATYLGKALLIFVISMSTLIPYSILQFFSWKKMIPFSIKRRAVSDGSGFRADPCGRSVVNSEGEEAWRIVTSNEYNY